MDCDQFVKKCEELVKSIAQNEQDCDYKFNEEDLWLHATWECLKEIKPLTGAHLLEYSKDERICNAIKECKFDLGSFY